MTSAWRGKGATVTEEGARWWPPEIRPEIAGQKYMLSMQKYLCSYVCLLHVERARYFVNKVLLRDRLSNP